jgi:hypothetical protein
MKRASSFTRDQHSPANDNSANNDTTRTWKRTFALAMLINGALPPPPNTPTTTTTTSSSSSATTTTTSNSSTDVSAAEADRRSAFVDAHYAMIDYHLNVLCHDLVSCLRSLYHRQCKVCKTKKSYYSDQEYHFIIAVV